jgi:hypothetical protein
LSSHERVIAAFGESGTEKRLFPAFLVSLFFLLFQTAEVLQFLKGKSERPSERTAPPSESSLRGDSRCDDFLIKLFKLHNKILPIRLNLSFDPVFLLTYVVLGAVQVFH